MSDGPGSQCRAAPSGKNQSAFVTWVIIMAKFGNPAHSGLVSQPNESMKLIIAVSIGVVLGYFIGVSLPAINITKLQLPRSIVECMEEDSTSLDTSNSGHDHSSNNRRLHSNNSLSHSSNNTRLHSNNNLGIYVSTNPRGAERLPPGIVVSESDLYQRRLWGNPSEDLHIHQKYLVSFTVGLRQKQIVDAAVKKFSENFTILLFHYDGQTSEWDEFEWSKRAIHISVRKQTKWWYAKRFLHPDIVAPYDYIFIWDEDLGVEHFDAEEYIKIVKKHRLEISQPGVDPSTGLTWQMTKRRRDHEVHRETEEKRGRCPDPCLPPCSAFVEIMAPVFSRDAWRCVWHMIQSAHETIGVVDSQWIAHLNIPSLGNQGKGKNEKAARQGVRQRCMEEWATFRTRMADAEKAYHREMGMLPLKRQLCGP
ncbi:Lysine ketoglutarate reductase trans-splicing related 1 [Musa troglodytarum]|uniref:Lysine ketoglutarate reductase trans-splicing related 1 n=1 Tax=Musa troglodytarum TaxID=320322 RepID=A0A9E7HVG6_9LILI|nr:Lysine ketoglutarate reductase trans-splicing related 1 [Musa troglodytarum]